MTDKEPTKIDLNIDLNIAEIQSNFKVIIKTLEIIAVALFLVVFLIIIK